MKIRFAALVIATLVLLLGACATGSDAPVLTVGRTAQALATPGDVLRWSHVASPVARDGAAMAYDAARQRVVLFGGSDGATLFNDTWTWDGNLWTQDLAGLAPSARRDHAMAYDAVRRRVVLFGGNDGGVLADTWEWDGATWTRPSPAASPSPRDRHAMAFDATRGRVVLLGESDTWEWDGTIWTDRSTAGNPAGRLSPGLAYDAARQRTVTFGGVNRNANAFAGTATWNGAAWTPFAGAQPQARFGAPLAYDASRQRVIVFGGNYGRDGPLGGGPNDFISLADTQEWNGAAWTQGAGGPPARFNHSMTYDATRQVMVLFGGLRALGGPRLGDTWEASAGAWTMKGSPAAPGPRSYAALAYDSVRQKTVMFGGAAADETWEWDGTGWTSFTPAPTPPQRYAGVLAYDATRRVTLLFGGYDFTNTLLVDTWAWDGATWTQAADGPPLVYPSMAFDTQRGRAVLLGGGQTWEWDGAAWSRVASGPGSPFTAMAYDEARGRTVIFGGQGGSNETREWDGATWTLAAPAASPSPRYAAAMAYDALRRRVVLYGGDQGIAGTSDTWEWDGTSWLQRAPLATAGVKQFCSMAYDRSKKRMVLLGNDGTWLLEARGATCTGGADATTPFCVDGVSCDASSCGSCEACNNPRDQGHCTPVINADDPDSCGPVQRSTCNAAGACKSALGAPVQNPADCASGFVVDGVCCEAASCGACQSCSAAGKEIPDNDGRCGTSKSGTDLKNDCADQGAPTCGRDGACDGRGQCRLYATGVACGAVACTGSSAVGKICSGAGSCIDSSGTECAPYQCTASAGCKTTCASTADCASGRYCEGGKCVPTKDLGAAAATGDQCSTGHAVDGVCCATDACSLCQTCDGAKKSTPGDSGKCGFARRGSSAKGQCTATEAKSCGATGVCNGTGECQQYASGTSCGPSTCIDNRATGQVCSGTGKCLADREGVDCAPYVCGAATGCATACATDAGCVATHRCDGGKCVAKENASCDGDHTLTAPDGTRMDCAPFKCQGSACATTCSSIRDCAYPNECTADTRSCVAPIAPDPAAPGAGSGSGCACRAGAGPRDASGAALFVVALGIFALRRRRGTSARRGVPGSS